MLVMIAAGQTEAEIDKVFLGRGDSPFTDAGKKAMTDAAETLAGYKFDAVYSSDLYRAQETLRQIELAHSTPMAPELIEELRERSGGSYEGRKYSDIRKGMSPKAYKAWERDPMDPPLHGESLLDVADRMRPWIEQDVRPRLAEDQTLLMVSHPDTMRVLIALLRGDELTDVTSIQIEHAMPYFYHGPIR